MGKIKRKRLRISRYSPTNGRAYKNSNPLKNSDGILAEPSAHSNNVSNEKGEAGLNAVHEKILSNVPEERMTGLNTLSAYALEYEAAKDIIEKKLPCVVAPLLRDPMAQVRLAAVGALKNLTAWGSEDDIDAIIQQDVLQPLSQLLKTYDASMSIMDGRQKSSFVFTKGVAHSADDKSDQQHLIFIHAINIMLSLCECSEEAVQHFNREDLVNVLLRYISPLEWSYPVALSVADCLLCVSENNPKICSSILPIAESLCSLVSKSLDSPQNGFGLHFATSLTGVLLNVSYWDTRDATLRPVFEVLNKALEVDALSVSEAAKGDVILEQTEHILVAQLIALEILSNICCPDGEASCDEYDDDAPQMDDDVSMEIEDEADRLTPDSLSPEILECIKYFQLSEKARAKTAMPSMGVLGRNDEEQSHKMSQKFRQLQIRALQCFQNLVDCLPVDAFGGSASLHAVWLDLGQKFSASTKADPNLLEAISGAMRAVTDKLCGDDQPLVSSVSHHELKLIFDAGLLCEVALVRANLCRMIGSLGSAVIKRSPENSLADEYERLSSFVDFLVQVSQSDPTVWVRAEALDVLIDLFSDDQTDQLAARVRLVERLKDIQPQFKAKYNQQRKQLGDHRPLVLTVRDNLMAFIKYKGTRTMKLARGEH